jgi:hypothetical protein
MKIKLILGLFIVLLIGLAVSLFQTRQSSETPASEPEAADLVDRTPSQRMAHVRAVQAGAVPAFAEQEVSARVIEIVSPQVEYGNRLRSIAQLTPELTEPDAQTLTQFFLQRQPDDDKQSGQVLKNRLLNALGGSIETATAGEWMGELLAAIHHDHSQHPVLRDYALQHLSVLFERLEVRDLSHGMRIEIQHLLWTAVRETDSSIAGTAIMALARLSDGREQEFNRAQINRTALRLASDSSAGELARISAFQVCGRLHVNEAMPILLEVAQMGETVALRVAAISALGSVGDSTMIPALQTIATSPVQRLAGPAHVALNQITESGRAR